MGICIHIKEKGNKPSETVATEEKTGANDVKMRTEDEEDWILIWYIERKVMGAYRSLVRVVKKFLTNT